MKVTRVMLLLVLLVIGLVSYRLVKYNLTKRNIEKSPEEKITSVKTAQVARGDIEEKILLSGDVHGLREVDVYTKVSGKLVKKIKEEGENVEKGEVIALIDRDEPALGFSKAEVKAPIDGTVIRYYVDIGDSVIPQEPMPQEPVFNVAYVDKARIVVNVGEKDISKVRKGEKVVVSVDAYPGESFPGNVVKVAPAIDPISRKLKVELEIENREHKLKPGMFADVEIIYKEHRNVLTAPKIAILERDGKNILFTVEENRATMKEIRTGAYDEEKMEIIEGINEGESVIIEGNYGLVNGARVEVGGIP